MLSRIMLQSWTTTSTTLCSRRYKIEGHLALWDQLIIKVVMVFSPVGSATGTPQIDPQAQVEGKVLDVQLISIVASTQVPLVYTNSTPMAMYAQGELHVRIPNWLESNYWTWYASGIHGSVSIKAAKYISFSADEPAR